jgi:hypothetical protein
MSEPVVSDEDVAAGPLLLPGLPGMPAPEFCPLGTVVCAPAPGPVVCAEAGSVTIATAIAAVTNLNMANSILWFRDNQQRKPAGSLPKKRFRGPLRSRAATDCARASVASALTTKQVARAQASWPCRPAPDIGGAMAGANPSEKFADSSRTAIGTAAMTWRSCMIIWRRMIWWHGGWQRRRARTRPRQPSAAW